MPAWLIPVVVLGALIVLLAVLGILSRVRGGRYLRAIVGVVAKIPLARRLLTRASMRALERQDPDLARAVRKMERAGVPRTPQEAQAALSRLSPAERRAFLAAASEEGLAPTPQNRGQRRQQSRTQPKQHHAGGRKKRKR